MPCKRQAPVSSLQFPIGCGPSGTWVVVSTATVMRCSGWGALCCAGDQGTQQPAAAAGGRPGAQHHPLRVPPIQVRTNLLSSWISLHGSNPCLDGSSEPATGARCTDVEALLLSCTSLELPDGILRMQNEAVVAALLVDPQACAACGLAALLTCRI